MGTFALPEGLAPEVYPLAWLVGSWRGEGVLSYPNIPHSVFLQEACFTHDGGPYLAYSSTITLLDDGGQPDQIWHSESGYWRLGVSVAVPEGVADEGGLDAPPPGDADPRALEIVLADPAGLGSIYLGTVTGPRIDVVSDVMARTPTGADVVAGSRMYGLVQSDLLWVWDLAAFGQPSQSYVSARLSRIG